MRKIVLFGDSITAGYLEEAVSPVLVDLVKRDIAAMGLEEVAVINAGMPGDTTEDGLKRLNKEVLIEKPDEVVIFFGANDASLDRNITVATFRENHMRIVADVQNVHKRVSRNWSRLHKKSERHITCQLLICIKR